VLTRATHGLFIFDGQEQYTMIIEQRRRWMKGTVEIRCRLRERVRPAFEWREMNSRLQEGLVTESQTNQMTELRWVKENLEGLA
jgi:hypothetical protein